MSENIHLKPVHELCILLDKVSRSAFKSTNKATARAIVEDKRSDTITKVKFTFCKGHLGRFDKLIFSAAMSEYLAGNQYFTLNRLWHLLGGGYVLHPKMRDLISESVKRLALTWIEIDMSEINRKCHYTDEREVVFGTYLLPCKAVEVKINSQIACGVYHFYDKSPLLESAELKKQYTLQPAKLLDVPKTRNSESVMKIKFYLLERVIAVIGSHKKHKAHIVGKKSEGGFIYKRAAKLAPKILLDSLLVQCELTDADRNRQGEYRKVISATMDHFKDNGLITDWKFKRVDGKFNAVEFDFKSEKSARKTQNPVKE